MHKRPLFVAAVFFIFGIVLAKYLPESVGFLHIFVVTLSFVLAGLILELPFTMPLTLSLSPKGRGKLNSIFLLLSVASFAALLYVNSNTSPQNHVSRVLGDKRLKTEIVGVIRSPALTRKPYYGKISSTYLFEVEGLEVSGIKYQVSGLAQIRMQDEKEYMYGDRLLVRGTIKRPYDSVIARAKPEAISEIASSSRPFGKAKRAELLAMTNRSNFNYKEYLENQNIFAIINTSEKNITLLSHNYKPNPILRYAYFIREKLKNLFLEKMPLESGAFLRAILLGDRSELPKEIQESFRNSGTMHILAISGLNVSLIAMAILYFLRFIRIQREFSYIFTILFLSFLAVLTGGTPSVVRATIMVCVFLIGMLLGRSVDPYNTLSAAALFILIKNPKDIFDVGFQLSFLAIVSMFYFGPKLMALVKKSTNVYIKKYLYMPFVVSLSASIGTFPLIMYYFRIITPISLVSNLFIVPAMFILLIGGLIFSVLGWVPFAGDVMAGFNNICALIIFFLAKFFSNIKYGHFYL